MLRGFIRGFTRYAGQIFDDAFENNAPATNFGAADFEDRYLQQEVRRIWNSSRRVSTGLSMSRRLGNQYNSTIHSLNKEVFIKILYNLDVVDQVCFALTCKVILMTYKRFIQDEAILLQQSIMNQLPLSFINSDNELRIRLLQQLENDRWVYCTECFSLKPRTILESSALTQLPLKRRRVHSDMVMKLCPCLHFTSRDRSYTRLLLRSSSTLPSTSYGSFGLESNEWRRQSHTCPFYSNDDEYVQISVRLQDSGNGLMCLFVLYTLHLPISLGVHSKLTKRMLACPHIDLLDLVYTNGNRTDCRSCPAEIWRESDFQEETGAVTFLVRHHLGWIDEPVNPFWRAQCCNPEDDNQCISSDLRSGSKIWHRRVRKAAWDFYIQCEPVVVLGAHSVPEQGVSAT